MAASLVQLPDLSRGHGVSAADSIDRSAGCRRCSCPTARRDAIFSGPCRDIKGPLVADAYIAALAIEDGCGLVTTREIAMERLGAAYVYVTKESRTMAQRALNRAARIAGTLYLLQMATGVFGYVVRSRLTVPGDLPGTAAYIAAGERLFRLAIATDILTVVLVIALCSTLYRLVQGTARDLARLGMALRLVENAVLCSWTVGLLLALTLLQGPGTVLGAIHGAVAALARRARRRQEEATS